MNKTDQKIIIQETIDHFNLYRFPKDVKNYKQYLWFNLDRLRAIDTWQANFSYPIWASIIDSIFANIYDFWYEFWVLDDTLRKILNETFDFKNQWRQAIKNVSKEALITGKWFVRTSLYKEEIEENILWWKYSFKSTVKKPTIEYISKFNIFYDHNYSIYESPFQIVRSLLTGKAIKKKYKALLNEKELLILDKVINTNTEIIDNNLTSFSWFSRFDFNPVKEIMSYQKSFMDELSKLKKTQWKKLQDQVTHFFSSWVNWIFWEEQNKNNISISNMFKINYSKSYEVIEYEEEGKTTLYINGTKVSTYDSLLSWYDRIKEVDFNTIPWTSESLWVMDRIWDLQELIDSIWNSFIDNIKLQLSWMFKVKWNIWWVSWNTMKFNKFGILRMNGDSDIERFEMWLWSFAPLNVVQYIEWFMSKASWVNDYQLWGQNKVERVTDWVDLIRSQYKSKLAVMIDSLQKMMSDVSRDWIMIYLTKFNEEELKQMWLTFTKEWSEVYMNNIKLSKLVSEESVTFTYNALETIDMEKDREKISMMYQALAQNGNVDHDELWNVVLGKKFTNIWKSWWLLKTDKEKQFDAAKLSPEDVPNNPIEDTWYREEKPWDVNTRRQAVINTSQNAMNDINNEKLNFHSTDKWPRVNVTEHTVWDSWWEAPKYSPWFNVEKSPSWAKVRKAIHNLTTTDISDKLSI